MKIKLSQYNPRKGEQTITKVSILTKNINLEDLPEIYLNSDAIHVMKNDTLPNIVLETKVSLKIRRTTREDIMLMLQRMMKFQEKNQTRK